MTNHSIRITSGRLIGAALAIWLIFTLAGPASASEEANLLLNSDLTAGTFMPDHWRPSGYARCRSFEWFHSKGVPGELTIGNTEARSVGWTQMVQVPSGWFHLSADLRTEGAEESAAFLAISQGSASALTVFQAKDWRRYGFYVRVQRSEPIEVECGLTYLTPPTNPAKVFFRDIRLTRLSGLPPAGARQFELDKSLSGKLDTSSFWITAAVILLLGALGFTYYWFADGTVPPGEDYAALDLEGSSRLVSHESWLTAGVILSFVLLLLGILAVTHVEWRADGVSIVKPGAIMGDEPHYVMVINSLLFDHDFELQDDYERVARGGLEAGVRNQSQDLDHHSIFVNRRTGYHAVISPFSPGYSALRSCDPAFRPFEDVYEVPSHPAAFSILMALAIAPFHPAIGDVEGEVAIVLALLSWLGALVTYLVGRSIGMGRARAMLATLLLVGASSWLVYSRAFFAESTIGLALILALWAMVTERPILAGISLALAAILKPPFAVVGIGFIIEQIWDGRLRSAIKLTLVMGLLGVMTIGFNYWLARTLVISGNQGWYWASGLHQLYGRFLESEHGLFYFVPWTIVGLLSIVRGFSSSAPDSKVLRQMALPLALYVVVISSFGAESGGLCYGPRFFIPFMPWFALATIQGMYRVRRPALVACGILMLMGALAAIPGALRYSQMFSKPPWAAWRGILSP